MTVYILDEVISDKNCRYITKSIDDFCEPGIHHGYAYASIVKKQGISSLSKDNKILTVNDGVIGRSSEMLTDAILYIKDKIESTYCTKVSLMDCGYVHMLPGSFNGMHSDNSDLNGNPATDISGLDYSAIIYLNESGIDYIGGSIYFPRQDVYLEPKAGQAIYFKGDYEHPHMVKVVKSGIRKAVVLFFSDLAMI